MDNTDRLLRVEEAGDLLALSVRTVRRMIADGELPVVRIRGSVRVALSSIQAVIASGVDSTAV